MSWCGRKKSKWLLNLDARSILVFDLETTGIMVGSCEILQIAITDGNGCTKFTSYIKPDSKQWKVAERVNGISPAMVQCAPRFSDVKTQVQRHFNNAKLVAGYNIKGFDIPIIERYGIVVPQRRFDVMEEFRLYAGHLVHYRLKDCADYFSQSFRAHDATQDAVVTAKCMQLLIHKPGFVNTDPPKSKQKADEPQSLPQPVKEKRPLWVRLLKPILKKRRFRPVLAGIVMVLVGCVGLVWLVYGKDMFIAPISISPTKIDESIMASPSTITLSMTALIGCAMLLFGFARGAARGIRWAINSIRRVFDVQGIIEKLKAFFERFFGIG